MQPTFIEDGLHFCAPSNPWALLFPYRIIVDKETII
jgi:hypothetical protein